MRVWSAATSSAVDSRNSLTPCGGGVQSVAMPPGCRASRPQSRTETARTPTPRPTTRASLFVGTSALRSVSRRPRAPTTLRPERCKAPNRHARPVTPEWTVAQQPPRPRHPTGALFPLLPPGFKRGASWGKRAPVRERGRQSGLAGASRRRGRDAARIEAGTPKPVHEASSAPRGRYHEAGARGRHPEAGTCGRRPCRGTARELVRSLTSSAPPAAGVCPARDDRPVRRARRDPHQPTYQRGPRHQPTYGPMPLH